MQDVETGFPLRSRIAQRLNVAKSVRLAPSLAAALQEDQFEHPGETSKLGWTYQGQGSHNGRSGTGTGAVLERVETRELGRSVVDGAMSAASMPIGSLPR